MTALVLVVEDEVILGDSIRAYLEHHGYAAVVARSGEEALRAVGDASPDVALVDLRLPGMDGLEVLRRLRSLPSDSWVPVAMVTAFSAETDRRRALDAGAAAYWLKPVDFSHLERELSTLLPRDAERRP